MVCTQRHLLDFDVLRQLASVSFTIDLGCESLDINLEGFPIPVVKTISQIVKSDGNVVLLNGVNSVHHSGVWVRIYSDWDVLRVLGEANGFVIKDEEVLQWLLIVELTFSLQ